MQVAVDAWFALDVRRRRQPRAANANRRLMITQTFRSWFLLLRLKNFGAKLLQSRQRLAAGVRQRGRCRWLRRGAAGAAAGGSFTCNSVVPTVPTIGSPFCVMVTWQNSDLWLPTGVSFVVFT